MSISRTTEIKSSSTTSFRVKWGQPLLSIPFPADSQNKPPSLSANTHKKQKGNANTHKKQKGDALLRKGKC